MYFMSDKLKLQEKLRPIIWSQNIRLEAFNQVEGSWVMYEMNKNTNTEIDARKEKGAGY